MFLQNTAICLQESTLHASPLNLEYAFVSFSLVVCHCSQVLVTPYLAT